MTRYGFYRRRTDITKMAVAYPAPACESRTVIVVGLIDS